MKIKFLIIATPKSSCSKDTIKSLEDEDYEIISSEDEIPTLNLEAYTHIILLPNDGTMIPNFKKFFEFYYEEDTLLLPLTALKTKKDSGVLNTCLWNPSLTGAMGELDYDLAIKQIDLTMFGALIPTSFLQSDYFNEEIKYYKQFFFFNKITSLEKRVVGIPKTLSFIDVDLTFSDIDIKNKTEDFNKAKEVVEVTEAKVIEFNESLKPVNE